MSVGPTRLCIRPPPSPVANTLFLVSQGVANKEAQAEGPTSPIGNVPSRAEAANTVLWRELDASKNSVSMAARTRFSHKELHGKSTTQMKAMLKEQGVDWDQYPDDFKRGSFFQRRVVARRFTAEELSVLPEKHEARRNPDLVVERSEVVKLAVPWFASVSNREAVVFDGQDPIVGGAQ